MCRSNLPCNIVHTKATKAVVETLKSRMIPEPVLLIPKAGYDAEFAIATDASKIGIAGVLLQEDISGSLRPCAYLARKLKDYETQYSA
jgi:hypothetical protein